MPAWHFVTGILFLTFRVLEWVAFSNYFSSETYERFVHLADRYGKMLLRGMQKMAEESAFKSPLEIDSRAFLWTFDCLDEDHELERFFAGLPGFRGSKMVKDPLPDLTSEQQDKLLDALIGLLDRTCSSDLLQEQVKIRRIVICVKAIGPAEIHRVIYQILSRIVYKDQYGPVRSAEIVHLVRSWDDGTNQKIALYIQAMDSSIVARAPRRDDVWFAKAADEMGVHESVLRSHATHGNDLSLAILIHVIRQQFNHYWNMFWPSDAFLKVLEAASKFDVLDTSPELQHAFCALWNQVTTRAPGSMMTLRILKPVRNVYLTLHLHADCAPTRFSASTGDDDDILKDISTYPLCNITDHHPESTPRINDVSTSMATPHTALHDNAVPLPSSPTSTPDSLSLSITSPIPIEENTVDVPLLDNELVPASPSCPHRTAAESLHESAAPPDTAASAATQDDPSVRKAVPLRHEPSLSTSSVPPPTMDYIQNNADPLAPSSALESLSSASPEPVLNDIIRQSPLKIHLLSQNPIVKITCNLSRYFSMANFGA